MEKPQSAATKVALSNTPIIDNRQTVGNQLSPNPVASVFVVIPAHNEAVHLREKMTELTRYARPLGIRALIIVENGSWDGTGQVASQVADEIQTPPVHALREARADYGAALDQGIKASLRLAGEKDWILMSAADLPFGLSDLRAFQSTLQSQPDLQMMLGSKGHPGSQIQVHWRRRTASRIFYFLRVLILKLPYRDTQGTIFVRADTLKWLAPMVTSRGFAYTTELVYRAHMAGIPIKEIPVCMEPETRRSSVKLFRDGFRILRALIGML